MVSMLLQLGGLSLDKAACHGFKVLLGLQERLLFKQTLSSIGSSGWRIQQDLELAW